MRRVAIEQTVLTVQELVEMAEEGPVVLTRGGVPIVGVVEMKAGARETWSLGSNPQFLALIEQSRARGRREGGVPLAEVRRQFTKPRKSTRTAKRSV